MFTVTFKGNLKKTHFNHPRYDTLFNSNPILHTVGKNKCNDHGNITRNGLNNFHKKGRVIYISFFLR